MMTMWQHTASCTLCVYRTQNMHLSNADMSPKLYVQMYVTALVGVLQIMPAPVYYNNKGYYLLCSVLKTSSCVLHMCLANKYK